MKKKPKGTMHFGHIATSERLKKTLDILDYSKWRSTRTIQWYTGSMAVHSDMAALRKNGIEYETRCVGRGRWEYRLI